MDAAEAQFGFKNLSPKDAGYQPAFFVVDFRIGVPLVWLFPNPQKNNANTRLYR